MNRLVLPLTFLLVCMAFAAWWFVGGGRERLRQTAAAPPSPAAPAPPPLEQPAKQAVEVTKRYRPVFGGRTIAERLDGIGESLLDRGVVLKSQQWKASPVTEGAGDAFEVTYVLQGKGFNKQWSWTVNPVEGTVVPREPLAERVSGEEMEVAALVEELSPPPAPKSPSTTLGKPPVTASPGAGAVPPRTPVAAPPRPAPGTPVEITLVGVVEGGGSRLALLRQGDRVREARVGDRLGGDWTLVEIRVGGYGGSQVVLSRAGERQVLPMTVTSAPAAGPPAGPSGPAPLPSPPAPPPGTAPLPPPPEPEPRPEGTPGEMPSDAPGDMPSGAPGAPAPSPQPPH